MKKLWQTASSTKLHPVIEHYTIGVDHIFDKYLVGYDALASTAHAAMLTKMGYLTKNEFARAKKVFKEIYDQALTCAFKITREMEDGHTAIEAYLTERLGELGGKIHLGRSRNDQSATAIRLFAKHELLQTRLKLCETVVTLTHLAKKYANQPMPGYTHTRPAMPASLGHYFAAYAEALVEDDRTLAAVLELADSNPLGGAAGYGSTVPVDRAYTTKLLGFARPQVNTLGTQLSRGKLEAAILGALTNIGLTLSRFAHDLINFSAPEYDFFSFADDVTTGSSIMPQKRNPDPLEIMRGVAAVLIGGHATVAGIAKGLPAGYQRDLQLTKQPFIEGVKLTKRSLEVATVVLTRMKINEQQLTRAAGKPELFAANLANELVLKKGMSFRDAYRKVKEDYQHSALQVAVSFEEVPNFDPVANIRNSKGLGMPGNLGLAPTEKYIATAKSATTKRLRAFESAVADVWRL